jgi:hypothetical protein
VVEVEGGRAWCVLTHAPLRHIARPRFLVLRPIRRSRLHLRCILHPRLRTPHPQTHRPRLLPLLHLLLHPLLLHHVN